MTKFNKKQIKWIVKQFQSLGVKKMELAKRCEISIEQLYKIVETYYEENNIVYERRNNNSDISKSRKERTLENAKEIANWIKEHSRLPRINIKGEMTIEEQNELRLGRALNNIKYKYIRKYRDVRLEQIKYIIDREIVCIMRNLENEYSLGRNKEEYEIQLKRKRLHDVEDILKWTLQHGKRPRTFIRGVTVTKEEEDSNEQREIKLGRKYNRINFIHISNYEGVKVEDIVDYYDRQIVTIMRRLQDPKSCIEFYKEKKSIELLEKKQLASLMLNLIKTKNATLEQIQIMADYYGVNLEDVLESLQESSENGKDEDIII